LKLFIGVIGQSSSVLNGYSDAGHHKVALAKLAAENRQHPNIIARRGQPDLLNIGDPTATKESGLSVNKK